jgi:hypothetical protein
MQFRFLADRSENEFGKTTRRDHTGARYVPRLPISSRVNAGCHPEDVLRIIGTITRSS